METLDPAGEWLRLTERYREMSDSELLSLARKTSELTEVAQQTLAQELSQRGLKLEPEEPPPPAQPEPPVDSPDVDSPSYAAERELVELCTVWSLPDALQLQGLLDRAGIPFFMGSEKATGVDQVTSSFVNGVSVKIMRIGLPWTYPLMREYTPADDPAPKQEQELSELSVRCPQCHSTEVIFDRLVQPTTAMEKSSSKFEWTCDSCGHQWEDDGVVEE
jgi:DNA-directed RNA polymerase subunit M/transcription elongation factor TFIIS